MHGSTLDAVWFRLHPVKYAARTALRDVPERLARLAAAELSGKYLLQGLPYTNRSSTRPMMAAVSDQRGRDCPARVAAWAILARS
jgi:hypothetical protein